MEFVKYVISGLQNPLSKHNSASAFKKLCIYGKEFLHTHTHEIIQNVLPEHIVGWTNSESNL